MFGRPEFLFLFNLSKLLSVSVPIQEIMREILHPSVTMSLALEVNLIILMDDLDFCTNKHQKPLSEHGIYIDKGFTDGSEDLSQIVLILK